MVKSGVQNYRRTDVITADPKRLVLMCYEGAIASLSMGKQKMINEDYEGKCRAITKAQDIINELLCALDYERGGAVAKSLDSIYNYMLRRILHADLNKDISAFDEVVNMLNELKSAWEAVFSRQDAGIKPEVLGIDEVRREGSNYISA
jgi:flagellar protein FliS